MVGEFTYTDENGVEQGILSGIVLDMAWGYDENDFSLTMGTSPRLDAGSLVYCDETEWGGIVDKVGVDETGATVEVVYSGRTWHGILASHVICPDAGKAYLEYDHDANELLGIVVANAGLGEIFEVPKDIVKHIKGRFYRYMDAYSALKMELWRHGLRLDFRKQSGKRVLLQAVSASDYSGEYYSDQFAFKVEQERIHVNHLIALGDGVLGSREVVHLYADEHGNVSKTQTIKGVRERTETYETSATDVQETDSDGNKSPADEDTLTAQATARLKELQADGSVDINIAETLDAHVGDLVAAHSVNVPASVTGTVNKLILNINDKGTASLAYEVGTLVSTEEEIA